MDRLNRFEWCVLAVVLWVGRCVVCMVYFVMHRVMFRCVLCGVWYGVLWCGVVWCGVVWCGVVLCGVVFFG